MKYTLLNSTLFCLDSGVHLKDQRLNIDVFAETREGLLDELSEQIMVMWIEYALSDDELLEISAQHLKVELLDSFEEISGAQ